MMLIEHRHVSLWEYVVRRLDRLGDAFLDWFLWS